MSESQDYIWVVTAPAGNAPGAGPAQRGLREIGEQMAQGVKLPVEALRANFDAFFKNVIGMVSAVPEGFPYSLEEIELSAEISGEGKIQLVGGISAGAKGGIKFKLKRVPASS